MYIIFMQASINISFIGTSSEGFSVRAGSFEEGATYTVEVKFMCGICEENTRSMILKINQSPYGGSCMIDPSEGKCNMCQYFVVTFPY